ncbi:hypothetical protein A2V82_09810 [candidate division KSB1 bacterium RBG_16_48_16]|nr:MAG: hypothetical protein A2V82_09810 [candidate division KSB1 bacterium RBG_16_48_16]
MTVKKHFWLIGALVAIAAVQLNAQAIVDNFNRATLGANWTADPEYQIVASKELDNTSTTAGWSYLAVYNAVINPFEVSFKFGDGSDAAGANAAGFAVYLDAASVNANGYFVMRRDNELVLHPIVNGAVDRNIFINRVATAKPNNQKGDILKVVASTNAGGHHFDVYLNGVLDGRVSDVSKQYGNTTQKFAGVALYGNLNNNIDDFTIKAPGITVTAPNGGEEWKVGSSQNITWTSNDFTGNVKIEFSSDNGASWTTLVASETNDGSYSWTVPNSPSDQCLIRITNASGTTPTDVSNAVFKIIEEAERVTLLSPNGGESWIVGRDHDIRWDATFNIPKVKIEYSVGKDLSNNYNWQPIAEVTASLKSYVWNVASAFTATAYIRISDSRDYFPEDISDNPFTITSLVKIKVQDASGDPDNTEFTVNLWMENQTSVRGLMVQLEDTPDNLTLAQTPAASGRAIGFHVSAYQNNNIVSILMVSTSGALITPGTGNILSIKFGKNGNPVSGTQLALDLKEANTTVSDANNILLTPQLIDGKFLFITMGDLVGNDGLATEADYTRIIELILGIGANPTPTDIEKIAADLDNDGDIDLFDLLILYDAL